MNTHRYPTLVITLAAIACLPSLARAQTCDVTGYTCTSLTNFPGPLPIPDGVPAGVPAGTISTAPGGIFTDVIAGLRIDHPYMGDLVATLTYDVTCDGTPEATALLICRQGDAPACAAATSTTFGCAGSMSCGNSYLFSDAASADLTNNGTDVNCNLLLPGPIAGGCFQTSTVGGMPLSAFDGLATGGCFKLQIADQATPDGGSICGWSVCYTFSGPTSDIRTSWGSLKTTYR